MPRNLRFFPPQCRGCGRSGHNVRTCPTVRLRTLVAERDRLVAELLKVEAGIDAANQRRAQIAGGRP